MDGQLHQAPAAVALIDCAGKVIGVDVAQVREVIVAPDHLQPLPSSVHGVVGCLALRGLTVPVVDFAELLGWPGSEGPGIIVVLRVGAGLLAFRAEGTRRIILPGAIHVQEVVTGSPGLAERLFPTIGLMEDEVIAILNPTTLTELGIPTTRDSRPTSRTSDISEQYLLFELGEASFVLPVSKVDGTVPETEVVGQTLVSGPCEGAIRRLELEIALINPLVMTGMRWSGALPRASAAIVLKFEGESRIALRADRVRDIIQIKRSLIRPIPRILSQRPDLFMGVVALSNELWYHVLDPDRLAEDPSLRAFAGLTRRYEAEARSLATRGQKGRRGVALLFRSGGDFALPIESVDEIVGLPPRVIEKGIEDLHLCNIAHRGALLPILSLSEALNCGRAQFGPRSAVIITQIGPEKIGLAVEDMLAIDRVSYVEHPDGRPEGMAERQRDGKIRTFSVIEPDKLLGLVV